MAEVSSCPSVEELKQFARGTLEPASAEGVIGHLRQCRTCLSVLESTPIDDTLIEALLTQSSAAGPGEKAEIEGLIGRLRKLAGAAAADPQATAAAAPEPAAGQRLDFLAPPQGAGEIGRLGGYRVLSVLGSGGMGMVLAAEDVRLKRKVALKVMKPDLAARQAARQRFLREAEASAAVRSDHVVTIYQVGEEGAATFLAMEYLEGMSLDDWLKKGRTPTLAQAARIGREIALGLAAAHERGLIHRDVKPANVWLESRPAPLSPRGRGVGGEGFRVKLLDFGLARSQSEEGQLTQSGDIVGTPAYMAPEQARGEKVDHRCDLFSLGVVLYRLTTGRLPFGGDNTIAVLTALALDTPPAPREVNPDIPPRFSALIERLMAKKREQRPATAKEVADELAIVEREAAQPAPDETAIQQASGRREPAVAAGTSRRAPAPRRWLVAAALLVLLGGVAAATIVVRIKTPDGQTKEMRFPDGTKVEVDQDHPAPAGAGLGRLDPAKIPAIERFAGMPKELVAVLGENRGGEGRIPSPGGMSVAISADGRLAASIAGNTWNLRIWDAATMREKFVLDGGGLGVVFAPDGKTLALAQFGSLPIWDLSGNEPKKRTLVTTGEVHCVAFSPDGRRILAGGVRTNKEKKAGWEPDLRLWDVKTGKEIRRFEGHAWSVENVAFSPDGRRALSGDENGGGGDINTFRLWDVDSGKELHSSKTGHVGSLAFSPDSKQALIYVDGKGLVRWDVEGWKELAVYRAAAWPAIFAPDQRHALVGTAETAKKGRSVGLLDLESGEVREFTPRLDLIPGCNRLSLALSADGRRAVSGSDDHMVRLWDLEAGKELLPRTGHTGLVTSCVFSPDGKTLASGGSDGTVRFWELTGVAPREQAVLKVDVGWPEITSVAFSPVGQTLAAVLGRSEIQLWNLAGAEPKLRLKLRGPGRAIVYAPDGTLAAHGTKDVQLWDLAGDEPAVRLQLKLSKPGDDVSISGLAVSPDRKSVALGGSDGGVELWDVSGKEPKKTRDLKAYKLGASLAFAPDGKTLATCGVDDSKVAVEEDFVVKLWDLSGAQPTLRTRLGKHAKREPQTQNASAVAFAPDGKRLASWSPDGTIVLWDAAAGTKLHVWHLPGSTSFAYAPDSRHLAVCMNKGAIFILRLPQ
jgi:WD40 repeat protein/tRNA A-37 threonylcarbamoyl transferase component Bud32